MKKNKRRRHNAKEVINEAEDKIFEEGEQLSFDEAEISPEEPIGEAAEHIEEVKDAIADKAEKMSSDAADTVEKIKDAAEEKMSALTDAVDSVLEEDIPTPFDPISDAISDVIEEGKEQDAVAEEPIPAVIPAEKPKELDIPFVTKKTEPVVDPAVEAAIAEAVESEQAPETPAKKVETIEVEDVKKEKNILPIVCAALLLAALGFGGYKLLSRKPAEPVQPSPDATSEVEATTAPDNQVADPSGIVTDPSDPAVTEEPVAVEEEEEKVDLKELIKVKEDEIKPITQGESFDFEKYLDIDEKAKDKYEINTDEVNLDKAGEYEVKVFEKDAEEGAEPIATYKLTVRPYAVGEGPLGTSGRVYLSNGSSYAIDTNKTDLIGSGINVINGVITDKIQPGMKLTWVDGNGEYAYDYTCTETYETYNDNGKLYLPDGTAVVDAWYGELIVINDGVASYWSIQ